MNSSLNPLHHHYLPKPTTLTTFSSLRRPRRHLRRRHPDNNTFIPTNDTVSSPPDSKLHLIIDLQQYIPNTPYLTSLKTAQHNFYNFISSGNDAVHDLRTIVTVHGDRRVTLSCRKSTIYFLGQLIVLSLVTVVTFKVLVKLGLGFRNLLFRGRGDDGEVVVTRRDRSLGGREVVVSNKKEMKRAVSPLASVEDSIIGYSGLVMKNWEKEKEKVRKEVPDWWPEARPAPLEGIDKEENQRKANWLIRGWFLKCEKHENVVDIRL